MNYDDVFDRAEAKHEWFLFSNIGDQIAGTFVDLQEGVDGYSNEQWIVVLQRDGQKYNVGIRKNHPVLLGQFKGVKFGQIIGLKYEGDKETKMGTAKLINLKVADDLVDEAWIEAHVKQQEKYGYSRQEALTPKWEDAAPVEAAEPFPSTPAPAAAQPVAAAVPTQPAAQSTAAAPSTPTEAPAGLDADSIGTIKTLLVNKNLIDANSPDDEIAAKVTEVAGLDMTKDNYGQIINKIAVYQA